VRHDACQICRQAPTTIVPDVVVDVDVVVDNVDNVESMLAMLSQC